MINFIKEARYLASLLKVIQNKRKVDMKINVAKKMYRICEGVYPYHGATLNFGRFITWEQVHSFLFSQKLNPKNYTIIDGYGIPF